MHPIYTIGHSNQSIEALIERLEGYAIDVAIDVRSSPFSRYSPQFNRDRLRESLGPRVRYTFLGDLLGGRPENADYYDNGGHVLYGSLSRSPAFLRGIELLEQNRSRYAMALLCSEADPHSCHRFLLITRVLAQRGWSPAEILHILGDGTVRSEQHLAFQGSFLEELWRSPQSVSPSRQPAPSSNALPHQAFPH